MPKIRPWLWLYQIILSGFEMICSYYSTTPVLARLKVIWTLLLITLASLSPIAALPTELQKEGNPELYTRLLPLAEENLAKLEKSKAKAYRNMLTNHDDILMAYLISYEEDARLAEADPKITLENYQEICKVLEREGLQYSPEFFLSYVARQSVSDERLSSYRKAMLEDGLAEVALISDPLKRFRETSNWCVEKLLFMQTSGRDQNPVDITRKSLTGRCEEMQILFVAAARTVGLPARPASTPWWAHMDNNHAWAEVYLDDMWHYTGDMDAAYFPNQTWFSGMIDKTVMILAEGSLASEDDEVLISGRYDSVINSTPNYAGERTRRVDIVCVDEAGEAVPSAQVAVMVYNWGALRPLIFLKTDDSGRLSFSAGSGDFYLLAYKAGKQALALVKASAAKINAVELWLTEADPDGFNEILEYPANEMLWQEAPEAYRQEVQDRKDMWQDQIQLWEAAAKNSIVPDSLANLARGNLGELELFWNRNQPVQDDYVRFLMAYDPKFLWQADARLLEAHYKFWQRQDPELPAELFAPTVFYEELPVPVVEKGELRLYPRSFEKTGKNTRDILRKAMKWQKRNYRIDPRKALSGLPRLDVLASRKHLSDVQYRMLAIYILRANGIPADFTRLPNNILVYLDHDWHYYNLKEGLVSNTGTTDDKKGDIVIHVADGYGIPITDATAHFGATKYVDGAFYSLNTRIEELGGGSYRIDLAEDDIKLFFGYRISDSRTSLRMLPLASIQDSLVIVAQDYPRAWQPASEDLLRIIESEISEENELVILGNHDQENSLRLAQKLQDLNRKVVFLGYQNQGSRKIPGYVFSPAWQSLVREDPAMGHIPVTLYKDTDGWKMYQGIWEKLP